MDYVGAPRNSKLINVTPTQNMWEQLSLAYDYGIDRLWILNVGDLKADGVPDTTVHGHCMESEGTEFMPDNNM